MIPLHFESLSRYDRVGEIVSCARTGERRFHDKLLSSARHWMDVDT